MLPARVAVLGASSFIGRYVLERLVQEGVLEILAVSRRVPPTVETRGRSTVRWASPQTLEADAKDIEAWISLVPVGRLPSLLPALERTAAKRVVALSTTSIFTKNQSSDLAEREMIQGYIEAEQAFARWAENGGRSWLLLRPTLVYDGVSDGNVVRIGRFARRFHFFPVFGRGAGLRQPVHAADVAQAAVAALSSAVESNMAMTVSGAEVLSYAEMVRRIMKSNRVRPLVVNVPLGVFRFVLRFSRCFSLTRGLNAAMAERMQNDMAFPHGEAERYLGFNPRRFLE